MEIGGVKETLEEILAHVDQVSPSLDPLKLPLSVELFYVCVEVETIASENYVYDFHPQECLWG